MLLRPVRDGDGDGRGLRVRVRQPPRGRCRRRAADPRCSASSVLAGAAGVSARAVRRPRRGSRRRRAAAARRWTTATRSPVTRGVLRQLPDHRVAARRRALLVVYDDVAARARTRRRRAALRRGARSDLGLGVDRRPRPATSSTSTPAGGGWSGSASTRTSAARASASSRRRGRASSCAAWRWASRVREGVWRGNLARLHRDGREIPVSQVIVARTDADGEVDFYATIARDMTNERAAEAALRASEERFRIAFEQAPVGMALTRPRRRYVQVNDAYCRTVAAHARGARRPHADGHHPPRRRRGDSEHAMKRLVAGEMRGVPLREALHLNATARRSGPSSPSGCSATTAARRSFSSG